MAARRLGIIMHGITGRMGLNQHLVRSIVAIRQQGGVTLPDNDRVMPDPILVGRNGEKIEAIARQYGIARWTTDLGAALANGLTRAAPLDGPPGAVVALSTPPRDDGSQYPRRGSPDGMISVDGRGHDSARPLTTEVKDA